MRPVLVLTYTTRAGREHSVLLERPAPGSDARPLLLDLPADGSRAPVTIATLTPGASILTAWQLASTHAARARCCHFAAGPVQVDGPGWAA